MFNNIVLSLFNFEYFDVFLFTMDTPRIAFIRVFDKISESKFSSYNSYAPPLGIASLIAFLKSQKLEVEYDVFDMGINHSYRSEILNKYSSHRPVVFAISSLIRHIGYTIDVSNFLKRHFPDVPIILGGPIVNSLYQKSLELLNSVDFAVYREGEIPLYIFIKQLLSGKNNLKPTSIPSLIYRIDNEVKCNPYEDAILGEDEIPLPDLKSIQLEKYFKYKGVAYLQHKSYIPIMTSRGCPFGCIFCHGGFGRRVRAIDVNRIVEYCNTMIDYYDADDIEVYDDIFNYNENRAKLIIKGILEHKKDINFYFSNGLRMDLLTDSFIHFLGNNNTKYIGVPIESASDRVQHLIKKRLDLKKAKENTEKLSKYNILLTGCFMIGFPTETKEEMKQTIDYALSLPIHTASFFRVIPYPGTELYNSLPSDLKDNILNNLNRMLFYTNAVNMSAISNESLDRLIQSALLKFYLRPSQISKLIRSYKLNILVNGFITFLSVLANRYGK